MNNIQTMEIIKNELKKNKKTMKNMIEDLKLSKSFAQNLTQRGSKPSIETMEHIAEYLNISLDYLIGREEQPIKIEQNVSHNTLKDNSIGIKNVQNIENNLSKELLTEFEKLSFKNKSYVMNIIAELNEPDKNEQNIKIVASPSRPEPHQLSQESIEEIKRLMKEIDENKL